MSNSDPVYTAKILKAKEICDDHNLSLPDDEKLNWDSILNKFIKMGGTTDYALKDVTWEDLESCGIPRIIARRIANQIFRQTVTNILTLNQISQMSYRELLENYDPTTERNPAVTKRLKEESRDLKFIVFNDDNQVNIPASTSLLKDLKTGHPVTDVMVIAGKPTKIYGIGETPNSFIDENPLYPAVPLRGDGFCSETNRSWSNIPLKTRQIVYLAITKTNELKITQIDDAHRVLDFLESDPINKAQSRYAKAAVLLQELEQLGKAPSLKLKKGSFKEKNDPFYSKHVRT